MITMQDVEMIKEIIIKMAMPLRNRVYTMITRAVIETVTSTNKMQLLKASLLAGEVKESMEHFQEAGFVSTPLPGGEAVAVFPGGNREHGIIVAVTDRRSRPKDIPEGGAAIYAYDSSSVKQIIKVLPDGSIELGKGVLEKILNGEKFQATFNAHRHTGNLGVDTGPVTLATTSGASDLSSKVKAEI